MTGYLVELAAKLRDPVEVHIASGYFEQRGFHFLADWLTRVKRFRLLLGADPIPPPAIPVVMPGEPRGDVAEAKRLALQVLVGEKVVLEEDLDTSAFAGTTGKVSFVVSSPAPEWCILGVDGGPR